MFGVSKYAMVSLLGLFAAICVASGAQASPTNDIAEGLDSALFDGENIYAAKTILTAAVMGGVGFLLATIGSGSEKGLPKEAVFIILFVVLGALTAIGWADLMFIFVASLLAVIAFVAKGAGIWVD